MLRANQCYDRSMDYLNTYNESDPAINFDDFFDGENLLQEDLVMWVNLGVHHIPHTGDLPNTVFTTAHTAIQIAPSNYFKYDQSRVSGVSCLIIC